MSSASADRKILRAFYTQYVAVLLIILTFTVGAFQRTTSVTTVMTGPEPTGIVPERTIFSVEGDSLFNSQGSILDREGRLMAIAEILKNHDINLRTTLVLKRLELEQGAVSLRRAMVRAEAVERFFEGQGVPVGAVSVAVEEGSDRGEVARFELIDVGVRP